MKKKLLFFLLGSCFFFLFVSFSYLVHKNIFTQFDFDITVRLQDNIPRRFDNEFSVLSSIGKFEPMIILLIVILVLRRKLWGIIAFCLFGFLHIIELFGKFFVEHPPPPEFMLRTKHLVEFPQFHVRSEFSYPSGHSGRALFISTLLGFLILKSKRLGSTQKMIIIFVLVAYDLVMLISRVYLGEHWASDVLGGMFLGISLGLLSAILF